MLHIKKKKVTIHGSGQDENDDDYKRRLQRATGWHCRNDELELAAAGERECDVRAAAALASDINTTRERRHRCRHGRWVGISSGPTLCARPPVQYTSAIPTTTVWRRLPRRLYHDHNRSRRLQLRGIKYNNNIIQVYKFESVHDAFYGDERGEGESERETDNDTSPCSHEWK